MQCAAVKLKEEVFFDNIFHVYLYLYISKNLNVTFIVATLLLSHIIHLFSIFSFLYLNFSSPYFQKKKTKKLFFSLLIHTPTVTLLLTFIFPFYLFISLLFYHYTSSFYILTLVKVSFYVFCTLDMHFDVIRQRLV